MPVPAGVFAAAVAEWGKLTDDEKKVYTANFKVCQRLRLGMPVHLLYCLALLHSERGVECFSDRGHQTTSAKLSLPLIFWPRPLLRGPLLTHPTCVHRSMQELMMPMRLWQQLKLRLRKLHKVALQPAQVPSPPAQPSPPECSCSWQ